MSVVETIQQDRDCDQGFTLIELAIVIAVIAILLVVSLMTFLGSQQNARRSADQQKLVNSVVAAVSYYDASGTYGSMQASTMDSLEPSIQYVNYSSLASFSAVPGQVIELAAAVLPSPNQVVVGVDGSDNSAVSFAIFDPDAKGWICALNIPNSTSSLLINNFPAAGTFWNNSSQLPTCMVSPQFTNGWTKHAVPQHQSNPGSTTTTTVPSTTTTVPSTTTTIPPTTTTIPPTTTTIPSTTTTAPADNNQGGNGHGNNGNQNNCGKNGSNGNQDGNFNHLTNNCPNQGGGQNNQGQNNQGQDNNGQGHSNNGNQNNCGQGGSNGNQDGNFNHLTNNCPNNQGQQGGDQNGQGQNNQGQGHSNNGNQNNQGKNGSNGNQDGNQNHPSNGHNQQGILQ